MAQVIPFITRVSAVGGFSPEERARLAELAERYAAAGVRVEVIYGATEEGDPWCVVKDEAEEVLIHVARIGDTFVVHHALDDALRQGQDLRSVLNERLAWDDRPEVVVPFSRQAQNLLALIVAAAFLHETARPDDGAAPAMAREPVDDIAAHAAGAAEPPQAPMTALAGQALHAESVNVLSFASAEVESARPAAWGGFDDVPSPIRMDHGAAAPVRVAAGGPTAPIVNLEIAAPRAVDGPTWMVRGFEAHPRLAAAAATETQTTGAFAPMTATTLPRPDGDPTKPPEHPPVVATQWVEVDTDGDGRPDTRLPLAEQPKPEKLDLTTAADHAVILAVGHGFAHAEIV